MNKQKSRGHHLFTNWQIYMFTVSSPIKGDAWHMVVARSVSYVTAGGRRSSLREEVSLFGQAAETSFESVLEKHSQVSGPQQ